MTDAATIEPATANPVPAGVMVGDMVGGERPEMDESSPIKPKSAGSAASNGAPEMGGTPANGAPMDGVPMGRPPLGEPPVNELGERTYAVQLTDEEWDEQHDLRGQCIRAVINHDMERADELQRKMIFPSFILKALKRLHGADFIRKEGYNTVDADLVYGPGWLEVDDGGPLHVLEED